MWETHKLLERQEKERESCRPPLVLASMRKAQLDSALGFHIGNIDICYSEIEGYINVCLAKIFISLSTNDYVTCVHYFVKLNGLLQVKYYVSITLVT